MDAKTILARLASKQPLFDSIPSISHKRICGTESEYGVGNSKDGELVFDVRRLPMALTNGGWVYQDLEHLEYCSPEISNSLEAVIYDNERKMHKFKLMHYGLSSVRLTSRCI